MKRFQRAFFSFTISLIVLVMGAGSAAVGAASISVGGPSDCDNNAIIRCGAHTTSQLTTSYQQSSFAQKVYRDFGIASSDMQQLATTNQVGRVTKSGDVYISGRAKPVASNAMTAGRQNMAGSVGVTSGGITYYKRAPSVSFSQDSLPAFVAMNNGKFQFAIIASCGNPVTATAIVKQQPAPAATPATPTPAPTPPPAQPVAVQQQVQQQQQTTVVNVPAQPTPVVEESKASTVLPDTGAGGTIAAFVIAAAAGTYLYRRRLVHKLLS